MRGIFNQKCAACIDDSTHRCDIVRNTGEIYRDHRLGTWRPPSNDSFWGQIVRCPADVCEHRTGTDQAHSGR